MSQLSGKTALITGGTAGIGLGIATKFASEGAHVYVSGRGERQLDEAVRAIGPNAQGVRADVQDLADLDGMFRQIAADGRRLDVVVANAGGGGLGSLASTTPEQFAATFDTNVRGTYFTVQKALPLLHDGASVILLSSIAAHKGSEGFGMYAAAKAAVRSFARTWANELSNRRIRVNAISPGAVRTPGLVGAVAADPAAAEGVFDFMAGTIPLGRVAAPDDIADVALFLAGEHSRFMTGTTVDVDGGQGQV